MANRSAYVWGACLLAAGIGFAVSALVRVGTAGTVLAVVGVDLGLGALLFHCALTLYGTAGGLGALALFALSPQAMAWNGAVAPSLAAIAQLAAVSTATRCLRDPTAQGAVVTGAALAAALLGALSLGESGAAAAAAIAAFSLGLVAARTWTAEYPERRRRVAHAAVVSMALAWAVAGVLLLVAARVATLPSPDDFSRRPPVGIRPAAAIASEPAADGATPSGGGVAPLLLAVLRPWRRQRRNSDVAWLLAVGCMALPLWRAAGDAPNASAVMLAPLAVLAGACWDAWRPPWARRGATLVVLAQAAALWPGWARSSSTVGALPAVPAATRGAEGS